MKKPILILVGATLASLSLAQAKVFTVVGDKLQYRNVATVESETQFETFTGRTSVVSGSFTFDPAKRTGSGSLEVSVASIDTGIPLRDDHMRSAGWLDAANHPTIKFVSKTVRHKGGDRYGVSGQFTMHGVTKTVNTDVMVRYRPASAETKQAGFDGNVVQLSTTFMVKLSDYGIKIPPVANGKVSNDVTVSVKAYALAK